MSATQGSGGSSSGACPVLTLRNPHDTSHQRRPKWCVQAPGTFLSVWHPEGLSVRPAEIREELLLNTYPPHTPRRCPGLRHLMEAGQPGTAQTPGFHGARMGGRRPSLSPRCSHSCPPSSQGHKADRCIHVPILAAPFSAQLQEMAKASESPRQQLSELVSYLAHSPSPPWSHCPTSKDLSCFSKAPSTFLQPWLWSFPTPMLGPKAWGSNGGTQASESGREGEDVRGLR